MSVGSSDFCQKYYCENRVCLSQNSCCCEYFELFVESVFPFVLFRKIFNIAVEINDAFLKKNLNIFKNVDDQTRNDITQIIQ